MKEALLDTTAASFHEHVEEGEVEQQQDDDDEKDGRRWCF